MPVPNWGPQAGVSMDQATFDAYVASNPPGVATNNVFWGGNQPGQTTQQTAQPQDFWSNHFMQQYGAPAFSTPFNTANQDQARLQQQQVIQDLQAAARGNPNSLAQQELRKQNELARSQQSSLGSTMRGQSAGAAQRGIAAGQAGVARELPGQSQMLQLQEQQAAQAMLAQMLQQQRQQDTTQAQAMAQNAFGNQSQQDIWNQFFAGLGSNYDITRGQVAQDRNRAALGFDLEGSALTNQFLGQLGQAGATALSTGMQAWGQGQQGGYRQVDGQNSIVPTWDK